jgi:hypothetical protein
MSMITKYDYEYLSHFVQRCESDDELTSTLEHTEQSDDDFAIVMKRNFTNIAECLYFIMKHSRVSTIVSANLLCSIDDFEFELDDDADSELDESEFENLIMRELSSNSNLENLLSLRVDRFHVHKARRMIHYSEYATANSVRDAA